MLSPFCFFYDERIYASTLRPFNHVRAIEENSQVKCEHIIYPRIKISVNTDISVIGFYGNIGNIDKYWWKFLQKYRFD